MLSDSKKKNKENVYFLSLFALSAYERTFGPLEMPIFIFYKLYKITVLINITNYCLHFLYLVNKTIYINSILIFPSK